MLNFAPESKIRIYKKEDSYSLDNTRTNIRSSTMKSFSSSRLATNIS